jgi:hypothetical protein
MQTRGSTVQMYCMISKTSNLQVWSLQWKTSCPVHHRLQSCLLLHMFVGCKDTRFYIQMSTLWATNSFDLARASSRQKSTGRTRLLNLTLHYASLSPFFDLALLGSTKCERPSDETSIYFKLLSTSSTALFNSLSSLLVATSSSVDRGQSERRTCVENGNCQSVWKLTIGPQRH